MPWKERSVMDERMRFVIRHKDGETMASLCREFGISRKTGYKILERYEQCEDIAVTLVEHALVQVATAGLAEEDVLARCHRGIAADAQAFSGPEARWIVFRLAELLEWQAPRIEADVDVAHEAPPA